MQNDRNCLPGPLKAFLVTACLATGLSLLSAIIQTVRWGVLRGFEGLWLFYPGFDFYDYLPRFKWRHTMEFFAHPGYNWYYPAPAIFVHLPFYVFVLKVRNVWTGYFIFLALVLTLTLSLLCLLYRELTRRGLQRGSATWLCTGTFLSAYPIYFAVQRGNIEALTWMVVGIGVWAVAVQRPMLSALMLGVAGSIKIYPALFLALLLRRSEDRRWLALAFGVFVAVTVAGLWYLDPDVLESMSWVAAGVKTWTVDYTKDYPNYPWDHSLFAQVRLLLHQPPVRYQHELKLYYMMAPLGACALAWRIRQFPLANQILFLTCAAVMLPPASFDYTLCMMYLPFALLGMLAVNAAKQSLRIPGLTIIMTLLAVVVAPEMFAMTNRVQWVPATIKCASLLLLTGASAFWPMELGCGLRMASDYPA